MPPFPLTLFGIFGVDITADGLRAQLAAVPTATPLVAQINSEGGAVGEATAVYNLLRSWPGGVTVEIVGWALSAATMVAMAGRPIRAHETSMLMVHSPWTDRGGNEQMLRQSADTLAAVAAGMRMAYARTKQPEAVISGWLDGQDHWFTAQQAAELGLIDEVISAGARAAAPVNVYACRHQIPSPILERLIAMPAPTQQPAAPATGLPINADAIRAEGMRIEAQRRDDIDAHFSMLAHRTDVRAQLDALQIQCHRDQAITAAIAGQRILAVLAHGVSSAAGGGAYIDTGFDNSRMADFKAAARDVLMQRAGIKVADPHPGVKDLQRLSMVAIVERMHSMAGISTREMSKSDIIAKGMSTADFPSLLSSVAGKSMRSGYATAPATFTGWTGERDVPDFKPQTLVALSEAPSLQRVVELGEYTFGALSDSASTFKIETYGRILMISRQALVNDDLSAFTNIPAAFGNSARRLEADMVYAQLTGNPVLVDGITLFHASHGNLNPAGGAPTVSILGEARAAMRKQKDVAGLQYIDPQPRFLIVPVALETQCEQLLASLLDPSKAIPSTANVEWVRGLTLVADPRLDAASSTAWYLAADPQQVEGIVRAYLQGEDRPHLEENAEFNRDAMSTKARLDIAAGVIDFRGLYKNPGA